MSTSEAGCAGVARHRNPRLHPRIQASEEGAGVTPRRSPRLHPRIHASKEDGAGVTCRRSPRLHPQIHASAGITRRIRRRRGTSPTGPSGLTDDDDMLREILLRLPPEPSSLPRASAVCRRWRGLVTDPGFHRQFYAHHRKPPPLGVFEHSIEGIVFNPILDPPDRIPPQRFSLGRCNNHEVRDCRHGLVLVGDSRWKKKVVVWDPITGEQRRVAIPPEFKTRYFNGAVLCDAGDQGHVHGGCPFKVVLVSMYQKSHQPFARVYSSETGIWGNLILTGVPCRISTKAVVLVGNCLYWLSMDNNILEFDLGESSLIVTRGPPVRDAIFFRSHQIIKAEDGAVGYAVFSYPRFEMWQRNINGHGVATWVLWKTIEMHTILRLPSSHQGVYVQLLGYDEDDAVFLYYYGSVYMVQLKSMQSRKLNDMHFCGSDYFPFKSFVTPGTATIAGG